MARCRTLVALACCWGLAVCSTDSTVGLFGQEAPWRRFAIDDSLRGADGVRLADADGNGLPDIATGWEESGTTRIYFHPGIAESTRAWPSVTVGPSPSVEDAVWVDLTGDGQLDVLSSCEGKEKSLRLHVAPRDVHQLLNMDSWETQVIPAGLQTTCWMYALPFDLRSGNTDDQAVTLIVGSKAPAAMVGLLRAPRGSSPESWSITKLCDAGWIMSLESRDVDRDGDADVIFSDRKGKSSGVYWLENPGPEGNRWQTHLIGGLGQEVMFLQVLPEQESAASGGAKRPYEVAVAVKPTQILWLTEGSDCRAPWNSEVISVEPAQRIGTAKSAAVADLTGDGKSEIVFSCEAADGDKSGVIYLARSHDGTAWQMHDVSGPEGTKFDRIELVDLDMDGHLDILTCEERAGGRGLGVIWYQNPSR